MPAHIPMLERFWSKVNKDGPVPTGHPEYEGLGPCWLYNEARGWGMIAVDFSHKADGQRKILAWRYSYELHFGPIPDGMVVRHRCDNGHLFCVNPGHLTTGTQTENVADTNRRRTMPFRRVVPEMATAMIEAFDRFGVPPDLLARIACVTLQSAKHAIYQGREGVRPATRQKTAISSGEVEQAVALLAGGGTVNAAAVALGRDWASLRRALSAAGVEVPTRRYNQRDKNLLIAVKPAQE